MSFTSIRSSMTARSRLRRQPVRHAAVQRLALRRRFYVVDRAVSIEGAKGARKAEYRNCLRPSNTNRASRTPSFCRARRTENSICSRSPAASAEHISRTFWSMLAISTSGVSGRSSRPRRPRTRTNRRSCERISPASHLPSRTQTSPTLRITPTRRSFIASRSRNTSG